MYLYPSRPQLQWVAHVPLRAGCQLDWLDRTRRAAVQQTQQSYKTARKCLKSKNTTKPTF